ncbi:hypothetical protein Efla_004396 [Eimeria flavescens]
MSVEQPVDVAPREAAPAIAAAAASPRWGRRASSMSRAEACAVIEGAWLRLLERERRLFNELVSLIHGAFLLIFGGLGLLAFEWFSAFDLTNERSLLSVSLSASRVYLKSAAQILRQEAARVIQSYFRGEAHQQRAGSSSRNNRKQQRQQQGSRRSSSGSSSSSGSNSSSSSSGSTSSRAAAVAPAAAVAAVAAAASPAVRAAAAAAGAISPACSSRKS